MQKTDLTFAVCMFLGTFALSSFPVVSAQSAVNRLHGENCSAVEHCKMNAALICTEGKCACSSGRLSDKYEFLLEWVPTVSVQRCLAKLDSVCDFRGKIPCIGAAEGNTVCTHIPGMPLEVGVCKPVTPLLLHGQPCTENLHCSAEAGLICSLDSKICTCASGALTHTHSYDLRWDDDKALCIANVGSACIGTRETPLPAGSKRITCVTNNGCINVGPASFQTCSLAEVHCEQLEGLPLGVGECKEDFNQVIPTTTEEPQTTPSSASISTVVHILLVLMIPVITL